MITYPTALCCKASLDLGVLAPIAAHRQSYVIRIV